LRVQKKEGLEGLKSTTACGPTPKLTPAQKNLVRRWIVGKDPRQYGFDFGLWTRSIVAQMIQDKFAVDLTLPSIGHLLTSLDITPQKPLRRAYERNCRCRREPDAKLTRRNGCGVAPEGMKKAGGFLHRPAAWVSFWF
jgi:transposase